MREAGIIGGRPARGNMLGLANLGNLNAQQSPGLVQILRPWAVLPVFVRPCAPSQECALVRLNNISAHACGKLVGRNPGTSLRAPSRCIRTLKQSSSRPGAATAIKAENQADQLVVIVSQVGIRPQHPFPPATLELHLEGVSPQARTHVRNHPSPRRGTITGQHRVESMRAAFDLVLEPVQHTVPTHTQGPVKSICQSWQIHHDLQSEAFLNICLGWVRQGLPVAITVEHLLNSPARVCGVGNRTAGSGERRCSYHDRVRTPRSHVMKQNEVKRGPGMQPRPHTSPCLGASTLATTRHPKTTLPTQTPKFGGNGSQSHAAQAAKRRQA